MHPLFELIPDDPAAPGFIRGEAEIARAARFKDARHFAERYLTGASTSTPLRPGVLSEHSALGHWYLVDGEFVTHPGSASVLGQRARDAVAAARRDRVRGWNGPRVVPASSSPGGREPVALGASTPVEFGRPFRLVGGGDDPGQDSAR